MPPSAARDVFLKGSPARNVRLMAARGVMPLPPSDNLQVLVHLASDTDPEVSRLAKESLQNWPEAEVTAQLKLSACPATLLDYFARESTSDTIREAIILNPETQASVIGALAVRVSSFLLEAILYNRARIIEHPEMLSGIRSNPLITQNVRRIVEEIESEFVGTNKSEYSIEESPALGVAEDQDPTLPFLEEEMTDENLSLEGLPLDPEQREIAILERLRKMPVPAKIKRAVAGTREERAILVRDPNRQVAKAVLKSPKLTENEIDSFAAMRNVSDEILREIGGNREWTQRYTVAQNLVKNPKTPPMIAQFLVPRLMQRDLQLLTRDRSVSEAVRRVAKRTLDQRQLVKKN